MPDENESGLRRFWDIGFKPIAIALIAINIGAAFLVAKLTMSAGMAEAYLPLQMVIGVVLAGIEISILDGVIRPDYRTSTSLKVIVIVGGLAAIALAWWVSSERVPREPDREMEEIREKLRSLPR